MSDSRHFGISACMASVALFALSCSLPVYAQQQSGASASAGVSAGANGSSQGGAVQQQGSAGSGANVQAGGSSAGAGASGSEAVNMAQVPAELETSLDSKKAKVGEAVQAKTTKTVKTADGVVIPKGSKLLGTVTQAQAHEKGQSPSMMAINFDRIELKNGQQMMVRSMINTVTNPAAAMSASDSMDGMMSAGPVGGGGGGGRAGLGGGLAGGVAGGAGGALGQAGNSVGGIARSTGSEVNETAGGAANSARGVANGVNGSVAGAAQEGSAAGARATSVPGVMLSNSASSATSGMLSAAGKNFRLDSGTQMMLSVAAQR